MIVHLSILALLCCITQGYLPAGVTVPPQQQQNKISLFFQNPHQEPPRYSAFRWTSKRGRGRRLPLSSSSTSSPSFLATLFDDEFDADADSAAVVTVWDGVLSADACDELHRSATEHNERAESSIFYRRGGRPYRAGVDPCANDGSNDATSDSSFSSGDDIDKRLTPLERAIDSILSAMGDDDDVVEYWSRQRHLNVDAHCDVDELLATGEGDDGGRTLRFPKHGHVLYLKIGERVETGGGGPTVVFPSKRGGWGDANTASSRASWGDGGFDPTGASDRSGGMNLVVVPAVGGRLLRFDGTLLHAVPRPSNRWLLSDEELDELVQVDEDFGYDVQDYDDYEEDDDGEGEGAGAVRSVLIFNTWPSSDGPSPKGVHPDPITGSLPEGIELCGDDGFNVRLDEDEDVDEDEDESDSIIDCTCNKFATWDKVARVTARTEPKHSLNIDREQSPMPPKMATVEQGDGDGGRMRVRLLGNEARRGCRRRVVMVDANAPPSHYCYSRDQLEDVLAEPSRVTELWVAAKNED